MLGHFQPCPDAVPPNMTTRLQANSQDLRHTDVIPQWGTHHHSLLRPVLGHLLQASGGAQYH